MSFWIHGSSSGHNAFSATLAAILDASSESVSAAVINAGGSSYVVGDILGITETGATTLISAQIEVTAVSTGAITGVRIYNSGSYTANPTTLTGNALTGGSGSSATIDLTMLDLGWTVDRDQGMEVTTVDSIANGGTGYDVGDQITLTGGTGTKAVLEVTTESANVITGVSIVSGGLYGVLPTDPVAQGTTDGTGTGATFNLSFGGDQQVIAHGEGSGTDAIYVGWRTYSDTGNDHYNLECHGLTGYSASLPMNEQPGCSPGDYEAGDPQDLGCYMIATNSSFNWWINVNPYRIVMTLAIGSAYFHGYMGWGNRFGTSTEYPYPFLLSMPSESHDQNATRTEKMSTITDPWSGASTTYASQTIVYQPGGGWLQFINRRGVSPYDDNCVVPTQRPQVSYTAPGEDADFFMANHAAFYDLIYAISSGSGGTATATLQPTGDDDDRLMLPCFYVGCVPTVQVLLEVDECRWCANYGGVNSEDRYIETDGQAWRIFANGNRSDAYAYIAIKEAS